MFFSCRFHAVLAFAAIMTASGPTIAQSASIVYFNKNVATLQGHKIEVDQTTEANADCSQRPLPAVELVSPPSHGHISTGHQKIFPAFAAPNPRVKCNGRKMDGLVLFYTPDARYSGSDFTKFRIGFSNGVVREISVNIDVK